MASADQPRVIGQLVAEARDRAEAELVGFFAARIEDCQVRDGSHGSVDTLPATLSVIAAVDLAEVVQQQALGLGMFGATGTEVEQRLGHAWDLLAQDDPGGDARRLGAVLTADTLTLRAAVCYTESGHGKRAADLFERVLTTGRPSHRDTGYFTARRAAALARADEPDAAATLALESAEIATGARSQRTRRVIAEVADTLQSWSDRPAVRALRELVHR